MSKRFLDTWANFGNDVLCTEIVFHLGAVERVVQMAKQSVVARSAVVAPSCRAAAGVHHRRLDTDSRTDSPFT